VAVAGTIPSLRPSAIAGVVIPIGVFVEDLADIVDDTEIVIGVLKKIFRANAIRLRPGIPGHGQVFFMNLVGRSPYAPLRSIAVKRLCPDGDTAPVLIAFTPGAPIILTLFHE
jgi:hypothetical protein